MIEARFYDILNNDKVQCHVCHHHCVIKKNKRGICGVRENRDGRLYALNYGLTIAVSIDPIEKKPLYHYLPKTYTYSLAAVGCNFYCPWCQNADISQGPKPDKKIKGYPVDINRHIEEAINSNCQSISYTYSEPTIYVEYAYDMMVLAKQYNLKNIWVSNGYMSDQVIQAISPYLDAVNIDIKGFNDKKHIKYCGGKTSPIRENIKKLYDQGIHVELTTLVVPTVNDDMDEIKEIAHFICELDENIPWHISRFHPAYKMNHIPPTPIDFIEKAKELGHSIGVKNIYLGNIY